MTAPNLPPRLISVPELAEYLSVTRATVYNLINRGMPCVKVGRCTRFRLADVESWLDETYGGRS